MRTTGNRDRGSCCSTPIRSTASNDSSTRFRSPPAAATPAPHIMRQGPYVVFLPPPAGRPTVLLVTRGTSGAPADRTCRHRRRLRQKVRGPVCPRLSHAGRPCRRPAVSAAKQQMRARAVRGPVNSEGMQEGCGTAALLPNRNSSLPGGAGDFPGHRRSASVDRQRPCATVGGAGSALDRMAEPPEPACNCARA